MSNLVDDYFRTLIERVQSASKKGVSLKEMIATAMTVITPVEEEVLAELMSRKEKSQGSK